MPVLCHRCGTDLPGGAVRGFCPHCGAPQILLSAELAPAAILHTDADLAGEPDAPVASTGAPPPPRPLAAAPLSRPSAAASLPPIDWPLALSIAAQVSAGTLLLFALCATVPHLASLSLFVLLASTSVVTGLYSRRSAALPLTPRTGAQIGLATGLLLTGLLAAVLAVGGVVARFRLHSMGPFDVQWANQLQVLAERTEEQARAGGVDPSEALRTLNSPEFRAWAMLAGLGAALGLLLALSTAAGAIAGLARTGRRQAL